MLEKSKKMFFWKGKSVTEKVYNRKLLLVDVGYNLRNNNYGYRKSRNVEKPKLEEPCLKCRESESEIGRRIVHIGTLGKELVCRKCSRTLSLRNIVDEVRLGPASVFIVFRRCHFSYHI